MKSGYEYCLIKAWERFYSKKGNKMKRFIRIIASFAFLWIGASHASIINDFTGPYSASNWSATSSAGGGITVNNSDPTSLIFDVRASDNPGFGDSSSLIYQTVAAGTGIVSFDWLMTGNFSTIPAPPYLVFKVSNGFEIGGDIDTLVDESGHVEFAVTAGEVLSFQVNSFIFKSKSQSIALREDLFEVSITNFSAPVNEPGVLLLIGLGLIGLITQRHKA